MGDMLRRADACKTVHLPRLSHWIRETHEKALAWRWTGRAGDESALTTPGSEVTLVRSGRSADAPDGKGRGRDV